VSLNPSCAGVVVGSEKVCLASTIHPNHRSHCVLSSKKMTETMKLITEIQNPPRVAV
jgi:hypothetical protein